jgi:hypothetical protein
MRRSPSGRPFAGAPAAIAAASAVAALAAAAPAGCSSTTIIYEASPDGGGASDGGSNVGGACSAYLACLKTLDNQTGQTAAYSAAAAEYGPSGPCATSSSTMQACEQACQQATTLLGSTCGGAGKDGGTDGSQDGTTSATDAAATPDTTVGSNPDVGTTSTPDSGGPTCAALGAACVATSCCAGTCSGGTCACPSPTTQCGSACADLGSDLNNCGVCGKVCNPNGQGLSCGPLAGVTGSHCWGFPFPGTSPMSCNDVCTQAGVTCAPSNQVAAYDPPATAEYFLTDCTSVPPATYQGGAFSLLSCTCYEP